MESHNNTQQIFDHHMSALHAGDLDEVMKDYSEESIIITHEETYKGLAGVRNFFDKMAVTLPSDGEFTMPP